MLGEGHMTQLLGMVLVAVSFGVSLGLGTSMMRANHDVIEKQAVIEERHRQLERAANEAKFAAAALQQKTKDCEVFISRHVSDEEDETTTN